jgi:hypothetical protein
MHLRILGYLDVIMDNLKAKIEQFCVLDEQLKTTLSSIKDLRTSHKELSEQIIEQMNDLSIEICNGIECKKSINRDTLNKDSIQDLMERFCSEKHAIDANSIEMVAEYIMENRDSKEKYTLKRKKTQKKS